MRRYSSRLGFLLAAACLLVSLSAFTGCGEQPRRPHDTSGAAAVTKAPLPDAEAFYRQVSERMGTLDAVDADFTVKMTQKMDDSTLATTLSGNLKAMKEGQAVQAMRVQSTLKSMGTTMESLATYVDGILYVDSNGQRVKAPFEAPDLSSLDLSALQAIDDDMADRFTASREGDDILLTFRMGKEDFQALWDQFSGAFSSILSPELGEELNEELPGGVQSLVDLFQTLEMTYVLTADADGNLSKMAIEMNAVISYDALLPEGEELTLTVSPAEIALSMEYTILQTGDAVVIAAPEDAEQYMEQESFSDDVPLDDPEFALI